MGAIQEQQRLTPGVDGFELVPVEFEPDEYVYLSVRRSSGPGVRGGEQEVAGRPRVGLDAALDGLMGLARAMGTRLQQTNASRVSVEFGCEFVVEAGGFVAVVGKVSATSTFNVALEWEKP